MSHPLTKTRQVLDFDLEALGTTHFHSHLDEEGERYRTVVLIDSEDWVSMGKPDQITITIEPGNLLN